MEEQNTQLNIKQLSAAIELSQLIYDKGLEGALNFRNPGTISTYNSFIRPQREGYKRVYGGAPDIILKKALSNYINEKGLSNLLESKAFHYFGQRRINSHVWACITRVNNDQALPASHDCQLYVLVGRFGIRFGFCYGFKVKMDSPVVNIVKSDIETQQIIMNILNKNHNLKIYSQIETGKSPAQEREINNLKNWDFWNNGAQIIQSYNKDSIPINIWDQIKSTFNDLLPMYLRVTLGEQFVLKENEDKKVKDTNEFRDVTGVESDELDGFILSPDDLNDSEILNNMIFDDKDQLFNNICTVLNAGKNIILIGPPGTGKTEVALAIGTYLKIRDFAMG